MKIKRKLLVPVPKICCVPSSNLEYFVIAEECICNPAARLQKRLEGEPRGHSAERLLQEADVERASGKSLLKQTPCHKCL